MVEISHIEFDAIVSEAIDAIPQKYFKQLRNVFFTSEDEPNAEQRKKLQLHDNQSLFGLYEGIPLTKRSSGYSLVLPDKITIFRKPIIASAHSLEEIKAQVQETIWHEVAHYFGLDHEQIRNVQKTP